MTPADLAARFPLAAPLINRLAAIDPAYGTHAHQRDFIERMHELQLRAPCAKEHEHSSGCYPGAVVDAVVKAQQGRKL